MQTPKPPLPPAGPDETPLPADDTHAPPLRNLQFPYKLGPRYLYAPSGGRPLFTGNESNAERLYGSPSRKPYVKDAFHRHLVHRESCVNPALTGTKSCIDYKVLVPSGRADVLRLRPSLTSQIRALEPVDKILALR